MNEETFDLKQARKSFSRIGLAMCVILLVAPLVQDLFVALPQKIWPEIQPFFESSWVIWPASFLPLYLVAIPAGLLIMKKLPAEAPRKNHLGTGNFLVTLVICFCVMYAGNIIGNVLSFILSLGRAENALLDYASDTNPLKILFAVILAPLLEEYVCRKQIIDRTRQYGEKTAVILSALCFGLLHQNLFQFFYAFGLGLIFGYVYIRTGKLRHTVLLHAIINFMGSVVAPWILSFIDPNAISALDPEASIQELLQLYGRLAIVIVYLQILLGVSVAGLVLLIIKWRKTTWEEASSQLPKGTAVKTVYKNVGMVLYILLCAVSMVLSLL